MKAHLLVCTKLWWHVPSSTAEPLKSESRQPSLNQASRSKRYPGASAPGAIEDQSAQARHEASSRVVPTGGTPTVAGANDRLLNLLGNGEYGGGVVFLPRRSFFDVAENSELLERLVQDASFEAFHYRPKKTRNRNELSKWATNIPCISV